MSMKTILAVAVICAGLAPIEALAEGGQAAAPPAAAPAAAAPPAAAAWTNAALSPAERARLI